MNKDSGPVQVQMGSPNNPISDSSAKKNVSLEEYLKLHTCYDLLPVSSRLIVLDNSLLVQKALAALVQNGILSAPVWNSDEKRIDCMLTVSDFINLIHYYWKRGSYEQILEEIRKFPIRRLKEIEQELGIASKPVECLHPLRSLYDAAKYLIVQKKRKLPLIDHDSSSGKEFIVNVITEYRLLKFIAINYRDLGSLSSTLEEANIGTYQNIAVAYLSTPVIDIINMFVERDISCVPIVDEQGVVLNVFEQLDVMILAKQVDYNQLDLPVKTALQLRSNDFEGVHTCRITDTLDSIFKIFVTLTVHRFIVVEEGNKLKGVVSLNDLLRYVVS